MPRDSSSWGWSSKNARGALRAAALLLAASACGSSSTPAAVSDAGASDASVTDAADGGTCTRRAGVPDDVSRKGPFPVGARTIRTGELVHEVWYPAIASPQDQPKVYDLREQLSAEDAARVPEAKAPKQTCDCVADLPIDARGGPYPVVVFFHGTAGFRTQSLSQMTHWASRGFIVVSTDHPRLKLSDALQLNVAFDGDFGANSNVLLDAIRDRRPEVSFLGDAVDLNNLAAAGHSAGGGAAARFSRAGVRVRIPMAAGGTTALPDLRSTLVLAGEADGVVAPQRSIDGYDASPKEKRLAVLGKAGHLAFSDICDIGKADGGLLKIAQDSGINVPGLLLRLGTDGCGPDNLPSEQARAAVNALTTFALEATLSCGPRTGFSDLAKKFGPSVVDVREEL